MCWSGNLDSWDIFCLPSIHPHFLFIKKNIRRRFDFWFMNWWRLMLLDVPNVCTTCRKSSMHCCCRCCRKYWMECATHFFFCCFFVLYARSSINTHFLNLFITKVGGSNALNGFVRICLPCVWVFFFVEQSKYIREPLKKRTERKWHLRRLFANGGSIWNSSIRCRDCYHHHLLLCYLTFINIQRVHQSKWIGLDWIGWCNTQVTLKIFSLI